MRLKVGVRRSVGQIKLEVGLDKLQVGGDKIRSKVVGIRDGSRYDQKTCVNIITFKVEKIKLEVDGFGSREEKIG